MPLAPRQTDIGDQFLNLISDPFQSQIQVNSIYASLIWAFVVSGGLFFLFVFLRPRNNTVYARRAKHADSKHAPPPLEKSLFAWTGSVKKIEEQELVEKIGLDAVIFLRFLRMLRNIFLLLAVIGCAVLIPINVTGGHALYSQWNNIATLMKFTPQYIFGQKFWAYVILALRRAYFNSQDYRSSLHSRTLLVTHLPRQYRTDHGLVEITEEVKSTESSPKTAVARNVKDLPKLIEKHDKTVRTLEVHLAKYLADPERLPSQRPMCKPFKDDWQDRGNDKVDAIDYLNYRRRRLEITIEEIRKTIDQRDAMSYGFISYGNIEDAHSVAYAARKKAPYKSTIRLAPKPNDLLWKNLSMTRGSRRTRGFWNGLWMVLLTIAFIPLNILSAVFLSDFSHLGLIWHGFSANLNAHPAAWGIAQGILAPSFQFFIFLALPTIFRRLYNQAGDVSKTSRERHVMTRLYAFFIINNLIVFSVFGIAFRFLAAVIEAKDESVWDAIKNAHIFANLMAGLCNLSPFWLTYAMQQNLSAAIDIAQLLPLVIAWYRRKFTHPTPRQLLELGAPQTFDYASYYNSYLYVATVGLCFGVLQPIIFAATAFYLVIELWFKRYLLQYILITKTESGGLFWKTLVNRLLFSVILGNAVIALIVGAQGVGSNDLIGQTAANAGMLYAMVPLPFLVWAFKWACSRTYDDKMRYYSTKSLADLDGGNCEIGTAVSAPKEKRSRDRVAVRFGHPALYKPLIHPMVHAKSQHLLHEILIGDQRRGSSGQQHYNNPSSVFGYSDMYIGESDEHHKDKLSQDAVPGFEMVRESDLDFENFKRREDFRDQFGGDGELYGIPGDVVRSGTPSTFTTSNTYDGREDGHTLTRESSRTEDMELSNWYGHGVGTGQEIETAEDSRLIGERMGYGRMRPSVDIDIPAPGLDARAILRAASSEDLKDVPL
ncbi:DUF221-domain-containing protein [Venturia nashicola]|nr:DUF221-domain-containing protein [Venturia nashicola]